MIIIHVKKVDKEEPMISICALSTVKFIAMLVHLVALFLIPLDSIICLGTKEHKKHTVTNISSKNQYGGR
jgi:hypothetical protein